MYMNTTGTSIVFLSVLYYLWQSFPQILLNISQMADSADQTRECYNIIIDIHWFCQQDSDHVCLVLSSGKYFVFVIVYVTIFREKVSKIQW